MSDAAIAIARYRSRLRTPMRFAGATFTEREGFFVALHGPAGRGVGEVAPLPGVHQESVEECIASLGRCGSNIDRATPPSLAFGLSVARALAQGDPVMTQPLRSTVGVNELIVDLSMPSAETRTAKIKVGLHPVDVERAYLSRVMRERPDVRLRIDANRSLTLEQAKRLLSELDPTHVDYLEEPLTSPLELPALHWATGMPIALDESLHDAALRSALETAPGVAVHVIKPSLVGSLEAVRLRAERTSRQGLRATITSTFESSYTLFMLARLITWLPAAQGDHGLGTSGMLLDDPSPPPAIDGWSMRTDLPLPAVKLPFVPLEVRDA